MEFGKLSEALLSKPFTVALLYLSAAAAKKMKEAEVVQKNKELGVGKSQGRRLGGCPSGCGETQQNQRELMSAFALS